jgi:hypothetical protein
VRAPPQHAVAWLHWVLGHTFLGVTVVSLAVTWLAMFLCSLRSVLGNATTFRGCRDAAFRAAERACASQMRTSLGEFSTQVAWRCCWSELEPLRLLTDFKVQTSTTQTHTYLQGPPSPRWAHTHPPTLPFKTPSSCGWHPPVCFRRACRAFSSYAGRGQ